MKISDCSEQVTRRETGKRLEMRITHNPTGELAGGFGNHYEELRTRLLRRLAHKVDDAERQARAADYEEAIRV